MTIRWRWIFFALVLYGAWAHWSSRPMTPPPGSVAPNDPVQTDIGRKEVYQQNGYTLEVLAKFTIEARVLGKEIYRLDRGADLAPVDLALGWGVMSDSSVLDRLAISQGNRFYYYRWENPPPAPPSDIALHSANMHLIPSSSQIEEKMRDVRVGQVVRIVGELVEARAPDGWRWRSSLQRDDTGAGACELIRVTSIEVRTPTR